MNIVQSFIQNLNYGKLVAKIKSQIYLKICKRANLKMLISVIGDPSNTAEALCNDLRKLKR